ncbi:hypothetical protein IQ279_21340 [Streptomyces verrucosisporus]|uniref:hypothetical protein n=1 Tax=Streptomyces verrucosisporus TaxID=1695161 RepID=UPI0019CFFF91|nr:hypothetical protein [Streptomyces verrucosisporus]MBN3932136.1 hypothetical protein [Streptomyces verrucosisporus]
MPLLTVNGVTGSRDHIAVAGRLVRTLPGGRAEGVEGAAHHPDVEHRRPRLPPVRFPEGPSGLRDRADKAAGIIAVARPALPS